MKKIELLKKNSNILDNIIQIMQIMFGFCSVFCILDAHPGDPQTVWRDAKARLGADVMVVQRYVQRLYRVRYSSGYRWVVEKCSEMA